MFGDEFGKHLGRVQNLADGLRNAGIPVPADIADAVAASKWGVPTQTAVDDARRDLEASTSKDEWDAAAVRLAEAHATEAAVTNQSVQNALNSARFRKLDRAVKLHANDLFTSLAGKYNDVAPVFTDAANRIGDIQGMTAMTMPREVQDAIATARETAAVLQAAWSPYVGLAKMLGYHDGLREQYYDFYDDLFLMAVPQNMAVAEKAATLMFHLANRGDIAMERFGPLGTHAIPPFCGIPLSLCEHPSEAHSRRDDAVYGFPAPKAEETPGRMRNARGEWIVRR